MPSGPSVWMLPAITATRFPARSRGEETWNPARVYSTPQLINTVSALKSNSAALASEKATSTMMSISPRRSRSRHSFQEPRTYWIVQPSCPATCSNILGKIPSTLSLEKNTLG